MFCVEEDSLLCRGFRHRFQFGMIMTIFLCCKVREESNTLSEDIITFLDHTRRGLRFFQQEIRGGTGVVSPVTTPCVILLQVGILGNRACVS